MKTKPLPFTELNPLQIKRFWDKVDKRSPDECWPWTGAIKGAGYGNYGVNAIALGTSRVGWFIVHGVDPYPLHVLHKCDYPRCCNPSHWFLGTDSDNVEDKSKKFRNGRKLNYETVVKIKKALAAGLQGQQVSRAFNIGHTTVSNIKHKRIWKYVPG